MHSAAQHPSAEHLPMPGPFSTEEKQCWWHQGWLEGSSTGTSPWLFPTGQPAACAGAWCCPSPGAGLCASWAALVGALLGQGVTLGWCREQHHVMTPCRSWGLGATVARLHPAVQAGWGAVPRDVGAEGVGKRGMGWVVSDEARAGPGDPWAGDTGPGTSRELQARS